MTSLNRFDKIIIGKKSDFSHVKMEDLKMEEKEISQQLGVLKSQPLSQSGCAKIIEILKMKLEIFKAKKTSSLAKNSVMKN